MLNAHQEPGRARQRAERKLYLKETKKRQGETKIGKLGSTNDGGEEVFWYLGKANSASFEKSEKQNYYVFTLSVDSKLREGLSVNKLFNNNEIFKYIVL